MSHVVFAEQELAVQIADLDVVVVRAVNLAFVTAGDAHKSERFHVLAAQSTRPYHKGFNFAQLFLNFTAKHLNLIVVAAVQGSSVDGTLRKALKDIIVKPLVQRRVFTCVLYDFLGNDTAEEGSLGHQGRLSKHRRFANKIILEFFNFCFFVDSLGES
jgi:hypothetical protein